MSSSSRTALVPLPIDPLIPDIVASLQRTPSLVLEAPPGAGKTTRVPRALLDAGVEGEILVLEPRRLAARMAARRVAEELGERVGERIGYRVRFDDAVSSRTRVVFVTEGVLTRRLLSDPELKGVGAVLLDEFHERHLQGDVALGAAASPAGATEGAEAGGDVGDARCGADRRLSSAVRRCAPRGGDST